MISINEVQDMRGSYQVKLTYKNEKYIAYSDFKKVLFVAFEITGHQPDKFRVSKEDSAIIKQFVISEIKNILAGKYGMNDDLFLHWNKGEQVYTSDYRRKKRERERMQNA